MKKYQFGKTFGNGLPVPDAVIYQVEELSLMRGSTMPKHFQRCDEITYVVSGKAKMLSGKDCSEISAGQIHFIKSGETHEIQVLSDEDFRYICIGYTAEASPLLEAFLTFIKDKTHFIIQDDSTVRRLCALLVNECYNWDCHSEILVSHYLSQILVAVYRIAIGKSKAVLKTDGENTSASHTIYQTLRYIDQEFINIEHARDVSQSLSYSEYYLSHLFKEKTGTTIKEYITRKKIDHACLLLKTSTWGVEEIAAHLHFASSHAFRRAFKAITNMSPSAYTKN